MTSSTPSPVEPSPVESGPGESGPGESGPDRSPPHQSWGARLYLGQAGIDVVAWRRRLFVIAAGIVLVAFASVALRGFTFGIEFVGGNAFQVPAEVGTLADAEQAVADAGAEVVSGQEVRGGEPTYLIRTTELDPEQTLVVKERVAAELGLDPDAIADDRISGAWGGEVTRQALQALAVFLALVIVYLAIRFEARAAIAAVSALLLDLVVVAGVYSLVGFEVTPATVIGFLTIMGFDLYDTVVAFDKVDENTRGITASTTQTYGEAANLAVNQVVIRSINTSVVALLPVGALLFVGAGLLGAGTLKDLGLVLFVGMLVSFYTSLGFAVPVLVELKGRQPRFRAHTERVLAKRAAQANRDAQKRARQPGSEPPPAAPVPARLATPVLDPDLVDLAGAAPKVGARPAQSRRGGRRRPSGGGTRR
jgi:preprotein translocase subunit SecF